ncbi:MAG: GNAT family N-acetyltransferase [Melioribacteraceae bacterium]|jgi:predicted acetyltransferase|nr:MAG: GNAT family N-acetyltransferase [Melioribacteraceae bacterium]
MKIRNITLSELTNLVDKINYEFISSKGKKLHITKRFPNLYDTNNLENLYVLEIDNKIKAFTAVKTVLFKKKSTVYHLFFVGSVYTDPMARGQGLSSSLLNYVQEKYFNDGYDAGFLWTNLHGFYTKLGWILNEKGLLAHTKIDALRKSNTYFIPSGGVQKADHSDLAMIDEFRVKLSNEYVIRKDGKIISGYGTVYSPGEENLLYYYRHEKNIYAYVNGVINKDTLIIYEFFGYEEFVIKILDVVCKIANIIFIKINLPSSDEEQNLLNNLFTNYSIERPQISMFITRDSRIFDELKNAYIFFTDRI